MDARIIIVLGVSAFVLLLLVFLFSFVYRYQKKTISFVEEKEQMQSKFEQALLQSQVEVQENTYRQIAKELHDNIGQLLSTTKMLMAVTEIKMGAVPDTLNTASATLGKAIQEIRSLSRALDKEWLEQFNFLDNLTEEVERINAGKTIDATIDCNATIDLTPEKQIILFRVIQEAVQNAIRHAQPSKLGIVIKRDNNLIVEVKNDGKSLPENFSGMGTNNMRSRTHLLGGHIEWKTDAAETCVLVSLPLNNLP